MQKEVVHDLRNRVLHELTHNILPFWMSNAVDMENGGFVGRIDGEGNILPQSDKGGILNARILWTFSAAWNELKKKEYHAMAERSMEYCLCHFFDKQYGGTYWKISFDGKPADTKKQIYSQAFFIYALSEYYKISGEKKALEKALELFRLIEDKSFDKELNGYFEAFNREWVLLDDLRLSVKDANEKKTTNTHLHILEAYTNLYSVTSMPEVGKQLKNLIEIFLDRIISRENHHLLLFFNEFWNTKSDLISYGHDIETSWLVYEAAQALRDQTLIQKAKIICIDLAKASLEGLQPDGSMIYEKEGSKTDTDRHWWPQAETVVGLINLYELSGDEQYLQKAVKCWDYIENNLVDRNNGEWYWSIRNGKPNLQDDKAGFWKCPYHNARACLEVIRRTSF